MRIKQAFNYEIYFHWWLLFPFYFGVENSLMTAKHIAEESERERHDSVGFLAINHKITGIRDHLFSFPAKTIIFVVFCPEKL